MAQPAQERAPAFTWNVAPAAGATPQYWNSDVPRGPPGGNPSEHGIGKSIHKEISYTIQAKALECYKFDGNIANFIPWKIKMLNHMASVTQKYRSLIERCIKSKTAITMQDLKGTTIDNFNAWEIAVEVESFTVRFLSESSMRTDWPFAATRN